MPAGACWACGVRSESIVAEHVHSDELATLALDDRRPSEGQHAHLRRCTACAEELAALRSVAERGRALAAADLGLLEPPGEHLWSRIAAAVDLPTVGVAATAPAAAGTDTSTALALTRPRRLPAWMGLAAGVALLAVAAVASVVALRGDPTELTTVELAALTDEATVARARLLEQEGHRQLALELPDTVAGSDEYLEVWLIDDAVERMVSLGAVRPEEALLSVPDGLDLTAYPIVDVSREPLDGDPLHSGDSIWRGRLRPA